MGDNNQVIPKEVKLASETRNRSIITLDIDIYIICCQASLLLRKQLAELNKNPVEGFSAGLIDDDDIYRWEVCPQFTQSRDDFPTSSLFLCLKY